MKSFKFILIFTCFIVGLSIPFYGFSSPRLYLLIAVAFSTIITWYKRSKNKGKWDARTNEELLTWGLTKFETVKIAEKNKTFTSLRNRSSFYIENKKKLIMLLKNDNNDLEKTVVKLYPKVGRIIDLISIQNGCYFSRITGSGSACIGIFSGMKSANYTKRLIKQKFPKYWSVTSKTI